MDIKIINQNKEGLEMTQHKQHQDGYNKKNMLEALAPNGKEDSFGTQKAMSTCSANKHKLREHNLTQD